MSSKPLNASRRTALLVLVAATVAACATTDSGKPMSSAEPDKLVSDAQVTLSNFVRDPDQTWIQDNLDRAKAILIAPQIVKAGFIFGGSGGRAVLVVRESGPHPAIAVPWNGPAFYNLATASVGFQAGVEVSEVVIVVMTDKGLNSLLSSSFKIGGDASIAAGPVGAGAKSTVTADLIAFSRAKGVYGGLKFIAARSVSVNGDWNDAYYVGKNLLPPDILIRKTVQSPKSTPLLTAVARAAR